VSPKWLQYFFEHDIYPQVHLVKKKLQTPPSQNPSQSSSPNWKVIYNQFKDHLANFCSQKSISLNCLNVNDTP
jgi:hypothetical protein